MKIKFNIDKKYVKGKTIGARDLAFWFGAIFAFGLGSFFALILFQVIYPNRVLFVVFGIIFSFLIVDKTISLFSGRKIDPIVEIKK